MRQKSATWPYKPRPGLEGPYAFATGRVLYYDVREGQYYDPRTDLYLWQEEVDELHEAFILRLRQQTSV